MILPATSIVFSLPATQKAVRTMEKAATISGLLARGVLNGGRVGVPAN